MTSNWESLGRADSSAGSGRPSDMCMSGGRVVEGLHRGVGGAQ